MKFVCLTGSFFLFLPSSSLASSFSPVTVIRVLTFVFLFARLSMFTFCFVNRTRFPSLDFMYVPFV